MAANRNHLPSFRQTASCDGDHVSVHTWRYSFRDVAIVQEYEGGEITEIKGEEQEDRIDPKRRCHRVKHAGQRQLSHAAMTRPYRVIQRGSELRLRATINFP